MKSRFLFSFIGFFIFPFCFSQNTKIDSLRNVLKTEQEDSNKVNTLNSVSDLTWRSGNYTQAKKDAEGAFSLSEKIKYLKGEANAYNNLGNICTNQSIYPEALKNHFEALKIRENIQDKKGIAASCNNIGNIYMYQGNYADALAIQQKGLKIRIEIGDKKIIANSYFNIGNIYMNEHNSLAAMTNHLTALKIREEIGDKLGIAYSNNCIAIVYEDEKDYQNGFDFQLKAFGMEKELGDKNGMAISLDHLGFCSLKLGKYEEATKYLEDGLILSKEIHGLSEIQENYQARYLLDSIRNNYKDAVADYKLFVIYRDSIFNEENTKKTVQAQMQYEFDKKEAETRSSQEKKDAIAKSDKERQEVILLFVIGGIVLVVGFALFIYRSYLQKQKANVEITMQKSIVENKQKEILDSIRYAKRIQQALLTSEKYIDKNLGRLKRN
jgi:tetratricopeptide (TPR) repeat protein